MKKISDGDLVAVPGQKKSAMAILASLTAVIYLFIALLALAEDHKTRIISFLSSGTRTAATAQTTAFDVSAYAEGQIFVNVTAKVDNPTLDVTIQTSPDNLIWYTHATMTQVTTTGQYRQAITNFGNYLRINHVVGATTSATYSITGVFKN